MRSALDDHRKFLREHNSDNRSEGENVFTSR